MVWYFWQIGGLDRSWQRPPGVAAKLIDSRASNGNDQFPSNTIICHHDELGCFQDGGVMSSLTMNLFPSSSILCSKL